MSLGLNIADPGPSVEDEVVDRLTACSCGRPRTLTAGDLLICPACDQRSSNDAPLVDVATAA